MHDRIKVADVRLAWDVIKDGLAVVKSEGWADWRLEDVYHLLMAKEADLLLIDDGQTGFCILQPTRCHYTLRKVVFIVATFMDDTGSPSELFQPVIDQYARDIGADYIEMFSRRKGWERKGYEMQDIRYRRRI